MTPDAAYWPKPLSETLPAIVRANLRRDLAMGAVACAKGLHQGRYVLSPEYQDRLRWYCRVYGAFFENWSKS